jgi:hypothetical protein
MFVVESAGYQLISSGHDKVQSSTNVLSHALSVQDSA